MLSPPSWAMRGSALSSSHHGANMPPASQEQLDERGCSPRSSTSTVAPRSASSTAQASLATPAPMTGTCTGSAVLCGRHVKLTAHRAELVRHLAHALLLPFGPHLVRDANGAGCARAHAPGVRALDRF